MEKDNTIAPSTEFCLPRPGRSNNLRAVDGTRCVRAVDIQCLPDYSKRNTRIPTTSTQFQSWPRKRLLWDLAGSMEFRRLVFDTQLLRGLVSLCSITIQESAGFSSVAPCRERLWLSMKMGVRRAISSTSRT